MTSNIQKSRLWKECVALYLRSASRLDVEGRPYQKLSVAVLDDDVRDVRGPGAEKWHIRCRIENSRDLSGALDAAELESGGKRFPAVIWNRPQRPVGKSFVIMSLDTYAAVLREQAKES